LQQFDIFLLTEARCSVWDDSLLPDHSIALVPADEAGKAGEGIVVAVRRNPGYHVQDWASNDTALWVRIVFAGGLKPLLIASCYVPPAGSPQLQTTDIPTRFAALHAQVVAACADGDVLVAGDFNARIADLPDCNNDAAELRGASDMTVNMHGRQLLELCHSSDVLLCTGQITWA
jgi:hypothetical protein